MTENLSQDGQEFVKGQHENSKEGNPDQEILKKKILAGKIVIVCLALGCIIMVIFILARSSQYFGYLFSLDTETTIKKYLKSNYKNYMAALYFSIFGLVIAIADAILLFFKFSQKNKLIWFHVLYYIAFFICGITAMTNKNYDIQMNSLKGHALVDTECITAAFLQECLIPASYFQYRSNFIIFFIIFSLFFALFTAVYHYTVVRLLPLAVDPPKLRISNKSSIFNANMNNQTFVSEMLDEYAN